MEALDYRRQLRDDVGDFEIFGVQRILAMIAIPQESVLLAGPALTLDHQAHRVRITLRRMRHVRRQQQNLAFADRNVDTGAVLNRVQQHVAFELVEEFFAGVVVIVAA